MSMRVEVSHGSYTPDMALEADAAASLAPAEVPRQQSVWRTPEALFQRRMFTDGLMTMPDGEQLAFWGFADPSVNVARARMMSPMIRVRENQHVHVRLDAAPEWVRARTNAQRAHGASNAARPAPDFGSIYQWQAKSAGTWLFQHHDCSPFDFEMGLFGMLIVDPAADGDGRTRAYANGPYYDVERSFILDDVDPLWHRAADEALKSADWVAPRVFDPRYFLVNGIPNVEARDHADCMIEARAGDKVLIRMLNASYSLVRVTIENFSGHVIAVDGDALGTPARPWTRWIPTLPDQPIYLATGARNDVLIDLDPRLNPSKPGGRHIIKFEFLDWSKRRVRNEDEMSLVHVGRAETTLRIV
ncbi:MAG: hypothetical protein ACRCS9_05450 [Hyphomicrobium sp.]